MIGAAELAEALGPLGVEPGGVLFVHARLGRLGELEGVSPAAKIETLVAGLQRAVADGTLILPTSTARSRPPSRSRFHRPEGGDREQAGSAVGRSTSAIESRLAGPGAHA